MPDSKIPSTVETRRKKAEERAKWKQEQKEKFPGVHFAPYPNRNLQLILDEGYGGWIKIRTNNLALFNEQERFRGWFRASMSLGSIQELGYLIAGLTSRLNVMIDEANESISGIPETKSVEKPNAQ